MAASTDACAAVAARPRRPVSGTHRPPSSSILPPSDSNAKKEKTGTPSTPAGCATRPGRCCHYATLLGSAAALQRRRPASGHLHRRHRGAFLRLPHRRPLPAAARRSYLPSVLRRHQREIGAAGPRQVTDTVYLLLHYVTAMADKKLKKKQKALYEALLKVKEELMLLGFISLLLTVFQGWIQKTCIPEGWTFDMLPCKRPAEHAEPATEEHFVRRLLSEGVGSEYCHNKGKAPLLSLEATHQLHIFIFVMAITHVVFSCTTMLLGSVQIHQWKKWENEIQKDATENGPNMKTTNVHDEFTTKRTIISSWLHSFLKQFYRSVSKSDYTTMRLGFIMTHCPSNPKFDFYAYMVRALEADFRKVVGISWYLWIFVVIFLLLNVNGWHIYFWISFLPLVLLLAVGTKLEHIIAELVHDVAKKHTAIDDDVVVKPSDRHFWFGKPRIILYLIHFILFQNSFEIAFFFWILTTYGFDACIMESVGFIVPRLVMGVLIQLICSYVTLPLYAIVTQMGSCYKKEIFNDHVQKGVLMWAKTSRRASGRGLKGFGAASKKESSFSANSEEPFVKIEMTKAVEDAEVVGNIE